MTAHAPGSHTAANRRIAARKIGCTIEHYEAQRAAGLAWCGRCRRWRQRVAKGWCGQCRARWASERAARMRAAQEPTQEPETPARASRPGEWTHPDSAWMASVEVDLVRGPGEGWERAPRR